MCAYESTRLAEIITLPSSYLWLRESRRQLCPSLGQLSQNPAEYARHSEIQSRLGLTNRISIPCAMCDPFLDNKRKFSHKMFRSQNRSCLGNQGQVSFSDWRWRSCNRMSSLRNSEMSDSSQHTIDALQLGLTNRRNFNHSVIDSWITSEISHTKCSTVRTEAALAIRGM